MQGTSGCVYIINRDKQQCRHGMRLRQKPYPILVVMQRKSGLFGSNIA